MSGLAIAYQPRGIAAGFRVGWLAERRTELGSTASGGFGQLSTNAHFAGFETAFDAGAWRLLADAEIGAVSPQHQDGLVTESSSLTTSAFALGASRRAGVSDTQTLAVSQPLHVEHGQATLSLPVGRTHQGEGGPVHTGGGPQAVGPATRSLRALGPIPCRRRPSGRRLAWTRHPGHSARTDSTFRILAGWRARF